MMDVIDNLLDQVTSEESPMDTRYAVLTLWALLVASTLADALDASLFNGAWSTFSMNLVGSAFAMVFPVGLNRGNNGMRSMYVLSAVATMAFLVILPNGLFGTPPGVVASLYNYLSVPVTIVTLYWLFTRESNAWFSKKT